jgi:transmembrane sensor
MEIDERLILKYLEGKLTAEELQLFENWLKESPQNQVEVDELQKVWRLPDSQTIPRAFNTDQELIKFKKRLSQEKDTPVITLQRKNYIWMAAASVAILVAVSVGIYFLFGSRSHIVTQTANTTQEITLPDGSQIVLNANSEISYQRDFNDNRKVQLTGEAFFDVKKDSKHPFVIETANAQVTVLGTSFNVISDEVAKHTEVFVVSGRVRLGKDEQHAVLLTAGLQGTQAGNNIPVLIDQPDVNVLAWKERRLTFNKMPLGDVVKTIQKYFKVQFEIKNDGILNCRFTGSFKEPTIEEVIESLAVSLDLKIEIRNAVYFVEGQGCNANGS